MQINILLPYKENFDIYKTSSVSITINNNLIYSRYLNDIRVFGKNVDYPILKKNFFGFKHYFFTFKSRNYFLAQKMCEIILNSAEKHQLIEIHNRPYLVNYIFKKTNALPISLFFHNDPKTMKGSKAISDRKNILHKCAAVFCVSEYIKKQFLDGITNDFEKVHVLYNGVQRKLKKFPSKQKDILFVGRLAFEKGADIFVDAVKSIAHHYLDWRFILIGPSKLDTNVNVETYAHNVSQKFISIGEQAKLYGFKDNEFVQEKMKNASIIIVPSREEAFGLVVAEAMSNGIAIIASKVGGIPEIVEQNGILINNINSLNLRQALEDLINNSDKRNLYQKKAWDNFKYSSNNSSNKLDNFRKVIFQNYF